jgi:hypothetical protein
MPLAADGLAMKLSSMLYRGLGSANRGRTQKNNTTDRVNIGRESKITASISSQSK